MAKGSKQRKRFLRNMKNHFWRHYNKAIRDEARKLARAAREAQKKRLIAA